MQRIDLNKEELALLIEALHVLQIDNMVYPVATDIEEKRKKLFAINTLSDKIRRYSVA